MHTPSETSTSDFKIPLLVGVVGHRALLDEEIPAIRAAVERTLTRLRDDHPDVPLTLMSSLAGGASLMTADIAHRLGIDLLMILPYTRQVCRQELPSDGDRELFDRLSGSGEVVELSLPQGAAPAELSRDSELRDRQLQHASSLIARYSGILMAIWNGESAGSRTSTARAIEFRRQGVTPTGDLKIVPRDALLSLKGDDLLFEIRCSRRGDAPRPAVEVPGYKGSAAKGGEHLPHELRVTLGRLAAFNRDIDQFGEDIQQKGYRLSQPSPTPIPDTLQYLDRLFTAADWLSSRYRRSFTAALRARYGLWALMAFLLITFKKDSTGPIAVAAIAGVLLVFLLGSLLAVWAHQRSWHRKYLDYRALAEALRVDFYWEIAGVRKEFEGEFAHESFLQKQDDELQWIRNAMRAVSLRPAIHPSGNIKEGLSYVYAQWIGDDHPASGSGQLYYYRRALHRLAHGLHIAERIDKALLFGGLILALAFAVDVVMRTTGHVLLTEKLRGVMLWGLALVPVYAAILEIYLNEKSDRALIRQYQYMYSLFSLAASELRVAHSEEGRIEILRSLGHACLAEHAQWILAHRDKRIQGMRW